METCLEATVRVLSLYVQRQFLELFVLCFTGFVCVFVVVDLAGRLSTFIDRGAGPIAIGMFYLWSIPYFSVLILPMAMLLASLFCFGGLARFGELTAMKAAGASLYRLVSPVLTAALLICACAFFLTDWVMPGANRRRFDVETGRKLVFKKPILSQIVLRDEYGQILSVGRYLRAEMKGEQVTLDRYKGRRLVQKIRAEELIWEEGGWTFKDGEIRSFTELGAETVSGFKSFRAERITLVPEDVARESRPVDQMSYRELGRFIQRKMRNGEQATREQVGLHLRLAFPFAGFVMVLFGIPLSSRTQRAGKPLLIGICLLVSFVYYGSIQAGRVMGWNGLLPPFWGAWAANLLFLLIGAAMLVRTHK
jgi:lipopolysaccharide export system permease protein